jgi:catalase
MADSLAEQAVDAINDLAGRHEGFRTAHAKGTLLAGTFTATPDAPRLTRAAHMQGDPVRATVRFSNGGGDPGAPDYAREGRGMAVKLYLPDGSTTDTVSLDLPCFFARTPEDFLSFTRARKPDPETGQPDMAKVGAWLGEHPEAQTAIQAALAAGPPESYATVTYNGIHSFRWENADGEARWVRFRWSPEAGEAALSPEDAKARGADYLQEEIVGRRGAAFTLSVALAEDGDPIDDPTVAWPEERERVEVGRLELTGPEPEREQGDDVLVFDPMRVTDGIEPSDDEILHFRPRAYAVSVNRRTGAPIPAGLG